MKKSFIKASLVLFMTGTILAGCGANSDDNQAKPEAATSEENVQKVRVISSGTGKPFTYVDEKGELTGFDIDVVNEIDKRIPELEFEWNQAEFASMFLGLDADRYDMVANLIVKTPERTEKYDYSSDSYITVKDVIVARDDDSSINSIEDLAGKKVVTLSNGGASQLLMEEYNENNPDAKMNLEYTNAKIPELLRGVEQGLYDATVITGAIVDDYNKEFKTELKKIDLPEDVQKSTSSEAFFLYRKDKQEIKTLVDEALKSMKEDGTLSEISMDNFGEDYTK